MKTLLFRESAAEAMRDSDHCAIQELISTGAVAADMQKIPSKLPRKRGDSITSSTVKSAFLP